MKPNRCVALDRAGIAIFRDIALLESGLARERWRSPAWRNLVPPPLILDGARVLRYAIVDETVSATGKTVHRFHPSGVMGPVAALAICQYDGEQGYYLLYCDAAWRVVTDTRHESIERALRQAEFEYDGISFD